VSGLRWLEALRRPRVVSLLILMGLAVMWDVLLRTDPSIHPGVAVAVFLGFVGLAALARVFPRFVGALLLLLSPVGLILVVLAFAFGVRGWQLALWTFCCVAPLVAGMFLVGGRPDGNRVKPGTMGDGESRADEGDLDVPLGVDQHFSSTVTADQVQQAGPAALSDPVEPGGVAAKCHRCGSRLTSLMRGCPGCGDDLPTVADDESDQRDMTDL